MSGTRPGQGRHGVPAADAAQLLGLNYEAVRKRIKRGTLPAYKEGGRWYVLLDAVPDIVPDNPDSAGTPVRDNLNHGSEKHDDVMFFSVAPAEVERAIEATAARYVADFGGLYDRISAEVGRLYEGQLAAKDETIATQRELVAHQAEILADARDQLAELRRRAEAAEAERDELRGEAHDLRWLASPAPPSATSAPPAPVAIPAPPVAAQGFLARVRRWLDRIEGYR